MTIVLVPGTVLSAYADHPIYSDRNPRRWAWFGFSFCRWRNWGPERWSHLPKEAKLFRTWQRWDSNPGSLPPDSSLNHWISHLLRLLKSSNCTQRMRENLEMKDMSMISAPIPLPFNILKSSGWIKLGSDQRKVWYTFFSVVWFSCLHIIHL